MQNTQSPDKKLIAVGIIKKEGKILIAQRTKKDAAFGKWEFPGGKLEVGETLEECLKRELHEELGIHAVIGEYFCTSSFYHNGILYDMCVFMVTSYQGEIQLIEHSAIAWLEPTELSQYEFPEPDLVVIDLLQKSEV